MFKVEPSASSDSLMGRSRTTAKEEVSSRWASRAETSSRMSMVRQQKQRQVQSGNTKSGSANANGNQLIHQDQQPSSQQQYPSNALPQSTDNIICQTWRHIQKALGQNVLQLLDHEQKYHSKSRLQAKIKAKTPKKSTKLKDTTSTRKANKNTTNVTTTGKTDTCPKSNNNAEMLANTITQLYVTNALQIQLEKFTQGDYDDDENDHDTSTIQEHSTSEQSSPSSTASASASAAMTTATTTPATTKKFNYLKSVLSILPTGFDETSALVNSVQLQQRKRAFMLLDLGRVISAHAIFLNYTCGFTNMNNNSNSNSPKNLDLPPTHRLVRRRGEGVNSIGKSSSNAKAKRIYIQPQFSVTKNPNVELLKLLVRLGVDLRCNSSDDVIAARAAMDEELKERSCNGGGSSSSNSGIGNEEMEGGVSVLVDDASKTRKPNGYLRRFLQTRIGQKYFEACIDGVDEVVRIAAAVRHFQSRAQAQSQPVSAPISAGGMCCRFMLRLPCVDDRSTDIEGGAKQHEQFETGVWEKLILNVYAAAKEECGELYGVSVDLSCWTTLLASINGNILNVEEKQRAATEMLNSICTRLRLFRLLLLSVGQYHIRIDLTGLPSLTREHCNKLTQALSNIVSSDVTLEELIHVHQSSTNGFQCQQLEEHLKEIRDMANNSATCSLVYTADISTHLVARAGALCARVIGVKSKDSMPTEKSGSRKDVAIHYFIDDGCYGSLTSSCSQKHVPVPLYGNMALPKSTSHLSLNPSQSKPRLPIPETPPLLSSSSGDKDTQGHVLSTVWGPTCDGLDKVCESVLLPKDLEANRDWLVFFNLGCGGFGGGLGLGTAFNGFDPPDISYCVLGYFSGGS